jgi:hypothetical protein
MLAGLFIERRRSDRTAGGLREMLAGTARMSQMLLGRFVDRFIG